MISFSQLGKQGRLGNQLFQIAATISTALKNNDSYAFPIWEYCNYFNLEYCFFDNIKFENIYREPFFHYNQIQYKQNMDLLGFFQSEKYFAEHKNLIIDLLTPKENVKFEKNLCGIHVRRGDYVNNPAYINLDMEYYNAAMNYIKADKYLIFSDDINWCKTKFIGPQFEFSYKNHVCKDLAFMAKRCNHMIIANSSFSWWGAYLNQNIDKTIIAPQKWFGPSLKMHNIKDLLPENWIKI